jgi:hypothetical protein
MIGGIPSFGVLLLPGQVALLHCIPFFFVIAGRVSYLKVM